MMSAVRFHIVVLAAAVALLVSCGGGKSAKVAGDESFPYVKAPSMMDDSQKLDYLSAHFWDRYFKKAAGSEDADSTSIGGIKATEVEQAMSNYMALLLSQEPDKASGSAASFADKIISIYAQDSASTVFARMSAMFERYIYDPNSPLRDEDVYTGYASRMARCETLPAAKKESYAEEERLTSLNRRGTKAADFNFCDNRGRQYSLYGIKAEKIILFFSNPGCKACKEIIETLNSLDGMEESIAAGKIAVLNIYIDEDIHGWLDYMPIYPLSWYNGYDSEQMIRSDELYNVRAIPSLYLLDADKTVLLKDVPVERLINFL